MWRVASESGLCGLLHVPWVLVLGVLLLRLLLMMLGVVTGEMDFFTCTLHHLGRVTTGVCVKSGRRRWGMLLLHTHGSLRCLGQNVGLLHVLLLPDRRFLVRLLDLLGC